MRKIVKNFKVKSCIALFINYKKGGDKMKGLKEFLESQDEKLLKQTKIYIKIQGK